MSIFWRCSTERQLLLDMLKWASIGSWILCKLLRNPMVLKPWMDFLESQVFCSYLTFTRLEVKKCKQIFFLYLLSVTFFRLFFSVFLYQSQTIELALYFHSLTAWNKTLPVRDLSPIILSNQSNMYEFMAKQHSAYWLHRFHISAPREWVRCIVHLEWSLQLVKKNRIEKIMKFALGIFMIAACWQFLTFCILEICSDWVYPAGHKVKTNTKDN